MYGLIHWRPQEYGSSRSFLPRASESNNRDQALLFVSVGLSNHRKSKAGFDPIEVNKGQVLDQAARHIDAGLPIHFLMLTEYFVTPRPAYFIKRLLIGEIVIYFMVSLPQPGEKPEMLIMSVHEPDKH